MQPVLVSKVCINRYCHSQKGSRVGVAGKVGLQLTRMLRTECIGDSRRNSNGMARFVKRADSMSASVRQIMQMRWRWSRMENRTARLDRVSWKMG